MTGALLSLVTEDQAESRSDFTAASKKFEEALAEETSRRSASPEEKTQIAKLTDAYKTYAGAGAGIFTRCPINRRAPGEQRPTNWDRIRDNCSIWSISWRWRMKRASATGNHDTHETVVGTIRSLILLMITAATVAIYASMRLSRGLLDPLISVTSSIRQVGEGNLDQTGAGLIQR